MKVRIVVVGFVCLAAAFVFLTLADSARTTPTTETATAVLPASLDQFYPPQSPAPAYLLAMIDMANPLSGIVCDVFENDLANAQAQFKNLKKSYTDVSNMVPEWKQQFPQEPLDRLEQALATGDPGKIMPVMDEVDKVCHGCHLATMGPAHHKYRWDRFDGFVMTDPLSGQDASYAKFMLMMQTNFSGIGVDLQEGQPENARRQFDGFKARFEAMADACDACHDSQRKYYVDNDITAMLSQIGQELAKDEINGKAVGDLLQAVGQESCAKCHLVHIPAAYAQQSFGGGRH